MAGRDAPRSGRAPVVTDEVDRLADRRDEGVDVGDEGGDLVVAPSTWPSARRVAPLIGREGPSSPLVQVRHDGVPRRGALREAVQQDDGRAVDRALVPDVEHQVVVAELAQSF